MDLSAIVKQASLSNSIAPQKQAVQESTLISKNVNQNFGTSSVLRNSNSSIPKAVLTVGEAYSENYGSKTGETEVCYELANKTTPEKPLSSSSPRPGRKWRIIKSVFIANNAFQESGSVHKSKKSQKTIHESKRNIPVLPLSLAIIFLLCNCLIPGLGTISSSFTFCCIATTSEVQDRSLLKTKIPGMICTNLLVGIAQLFTATFLLVGWIWSIYWGLTMLYLALDKRDHIRNSAN